MFVKENEDRKKKSYQLSNSQAGVITKSYNVTEVDLGFLSNLHDWGFRENSYLLLAIHYFFKKSSFMDFWQPLNYASENNAEYIELTIKIP